MRPAEDLIRCELPFISCLPERRKPTCCPALPNPSRAASGCPHAGAAHSAAPPAAMPQLVALGLFSEHARNTQLPDRTVDLTFASRPTNPPPPLIRLLCRPADMLFYLNTDLFLVQRPSTSSSPAARPRISTLALRRLKSSPPLAACLSLPSLYRLSRWLSQEPSFLWSRPCHHKRAPFDVRFCCLPQSLASLPDSRALAHSSRRRQSRLPIRPREGPRSQPGSFQPCSSPLPRRGRRI